MCGRYTLTYGDLGAVVAELDALLDPAAAELHRPRYNIAPTHAAIIARPGPGKPVTMGETPQSPWGLRPAVTMGAPPPNPRSAPAQPVLVPALWGLHRDQRLIINARSENAPARFPAAFQHGRCVVPADGFYEWTGERSERRPIWFHHPSGAPLLMAGLFEQGPGGAPANFVVLTTASRPPVAAIHDRMPVLLSSAGARRWILGAPPRAVQPDDVLLVARPVSPRVNAVAHDDPACLEPPPEPEADHEKQLDLFR